MALDQAVNQETGSSGRRYQGITLTCGRVKFGAIATPTGCRCVSNNYINQCHRRFELVGVSCSWSSSRSSRQWEPAPDRGMGPSGRWLGSPAEWGRSVSIVRGTWGQYVAVCSVSNSPLIQNQYQPFHNPFENKVWEVYFSKEVCSFVIIVDYVSLHSCICIIAIQHGENPVLFHLRGKIPYENKAVNSYTVTYVVPSISFQTFLNKHLKLS